jgi:hypothetical protein
MLPPAAIAWMLGRPDDEANSLCSRPERNPWV